MTHLPVTKNVFYYSMKSLISFIVNFISLIFKQWQKKANILFNWQLIKLWINCLEKLS